MKIFITSELFMNINSHIEVHNYFHSKKNLIFLLISTNSNFIIKDSNNNLSK